MLGMRARNDASRAAVVARPRHRVRRRWRVALADKEAAEAVTEHASYNEAVAEQASYNYAHFDQHVAEGGHREAEAAFRASFRAGQRAADFTLPQLDGAQVRLSELWRDKPLVMEFGSFT
jgi:hypothetical protein